MLSLLIFFAAQAFAQTSDLYTAPANPLILKVDLNTNATVQKFISPKEGGSLELTDSKKNKYKLTIPAGAIDQGITFSMTEVRELGGDSNVAKENTFGVQIEPAGTEFTKFASLEIIPSRALPVKELAPFSYYDQGENVHLAAAKMTPEKISLPLAHLSGYGVVQSMQFRKDASTHLSNLLVDRLQNVLLEEAIKLQNGEIDQIPADFADKLAEDFYNQVIKPSMGNVKSCRQAQAVADTFWQVQRALSIAGSDEAGEKFFSKHSAEFTASWSTWMSQCAQQFGENCVNQGMYPAFITFEFNALKRCALLEGSGCEKTQGYQELLDWEKRCLNFDVSLKVSFLQKENPGPDLKMSIKIPYQLSPSGANVKPPEVEYEVEVPQFASGTDSGVKCKLLSVKSSPGIFQLNLIDIFKMRSDAYGKSSLWFDIGMPKTMATGRCVEIDEPHSTFDLTLPAIDAGSYYAGLFRAVHDFEFDMEFGMYRFRELQIDYGSTILARKSFSIYSSDLMMDEEFEFLMKHDPK